MRILTCLTAAALVVGLGVSVAAGAKKDEKKGHEVALEYIEEQKIPAFKGGHTLPPLTLWRNMHIDIEKLLAEKWGYAWYGVTSPSPAIRAPRRGCSGPYSSRVAIRPGISVSAMASSLRPHSARPMSFTA